MLSSESTKTTIFSELREHIFKKLAPHNIVNFLYFVTYFSYILDKNILNFKTYCWTKLKSMIERGLKDVLAGVYEKWQIVTLFQIIF